MACPKCKCKVTYPYLVGDFMEETDYEVCAACNHVFYIETAIEDDYEDYEPVEQETP